MKRWPWTLQRSSTVRHSARHAKGDARADYPAEAAVRRVRHKGEIRWNGGFVYVSQTLAGEAVAATETADGQWALSFHAPVVTSRYKV